MASSTAIVGDGRQLGGRARSRDHLETGPRDAASRGRGGRARARPVWSWCGPILLAGVLIWIAAWIVGLKVLVLWLVAGTLLALLVGAVVAESERIGRPGRPIAERIAAPGCVLLSPDAPHRRLLWDWAQSRRSLLLSGGADMAVAAAAAGEELGTKVEVRDLEDVVELMACVESYRRGIA